MNAEATDVGTTFEDAIREHLIENRGELVKQAVSKAIGSMAESMRYTAMNLASTAVQEFFAKEVGPALAKHLSDQRETIVAHYVATVQEVLHAGLKSQAEKWMKDVTSDNDYTRGSAITAMFGAKSVR